MQDIRKPYSRSRSNRALSARVVAFEKQDYEEEKPVSGRNAVHHHAPTRGHSARLDRDVSIYPRRQEIPRPPRKDRSFETILFSSIFAVVIFIVLLLTFVFDGATVTITPKFVDVVNGDKTIIFDKDNKGDVSFVIATTTLEKKRELARSLEKKVESKAEGKIIIYNNYDDQPQRLLKNTRFESSDGKIYRINDSITVPGKKPDLPGSIEVTVYADSYGEEYNIPPSDFTIPGFKGSPRYAGFYARSAEAMKGGSSGNAKLVSPSDLSAAKDELALSLTQEVKNELKKQTKAEHIPLYQSIAVTFSDNEKEILAGQSNVYTVKATGYLIFANESSLAKALLKTESQSQYRDEPLRLDYEDAITFSLRETTNITKDSRFEVLVSGKPRVVWVVDEKALREALAGKEKDSFTEVMNGVSSVKIAEMDIFPSWNSSFPKSVDKIEVVEKLPALSN